MATEKNTTEPTLADTDETSDASRSPLKKISQRLQIIREKLQDAWAEVDAEKRAALLKIIVAVSVGIVVIFIGWKLFFGSADTTDPVITETVLTEEVVLEAVPVTATQINPATPATPTDNRVLPALRTGNLETWSGLKKDSYEMKKRGQLKTLPTKLWEFIPGAK